MNKLLNIQYLLIIIIIAVTSCDKYDISSTQAESFIKLFGSSGEDKAGNMLQLPDGGYAIIGSLQTTEKGSDIYFIRTDAYGNETDTVTFGGNLNDAGYDLLLENDGSILLLGSTTDTLANGESNKNALLIKLDANGNTLWKKSIGTENDEEAFTIIRTSAGEYAMGGYQYSNTNNSNDFWFVNLTSDYEVKNNRRFGYPSQDNEIISLEEYEGTGFVALGTKSSASGKDITTLLIDNNGISINDVTLNRAGNDEAGNILKLDAGFMSINSVLNPEDSRTEILLLEFTISNDDILYQELETRNIEEGNVSGADICSTSDGGFCIIGTSTIAGNEGIYIRKENNSGDILFSETYSATGSQRGLKIQETPDGGFIILGTNAFDGNSMITLMKTKPDGSF